MSSLPPSALKSLDDSLALLGETMEKLTAAKSVDVSEVIEQLNVAAKSAQIVRELLSSELPEASWQNREDLNALMEKIQEISDARTQEQIRSRLLALATELECGSIVHRRAHRVNELNQLRDQAIDELRSQAALEKAPQNLPGPQADRWIEWACGLKEPQDAESLQSLRNGFAHLDDFVANLEPNMWIAGRLPTSETLQDPERSVDTAQQGQPRLQTNEVEEKPRFPDDLLDELPLPAIESNTPAPNDSTPPQTEEELERTLAQERALLASMMGFDAGPHSNVEQPSIAKTFLETSATPETAPDTSAGVRGPGKRKWWFATTGVVLVFALLGAVQWRSRWSHTSSRPVEAAVEQKISEPTPSNPENKGYVQTVMSTNSESHTSSPLTQNQQRPKSQDSSVATKPLSKASPTKQANDIQAAVLRPPAETPRNVAMVTKEEAPPNGTAEMPGPIPGGLPNGVPNSVPNIVKDIPVAVPKIADKVRVSSGVAEGLLIHQVTPQYPPLARQAHIQGTVVFQALIGKDGTVQNLHVLRGSPLLIGAATEAVRKWRYKPYSLNGEPVEADTQINVKFTLPGG